MLKEPSAAESTPTYDEQAAGPSKAFSASPGTGNQPATTLR
jgi:hypothetical protein